MNKKIKDPYFPSVYGIGYLGEGQYTTTIKGKTTKVYRLWSGMLGRCYDYKIQEKYPTYIGCEVCEEWLNFQIFTQWFHENYVEGYVLDKDILVKGNKIYSPETCCFVPEHINLLFIKNNKNRSKYSIGVKKDKNRFRVIMKQRGKYKHIGMYSTVELASNSYIEAKEAYIKEIADEFKNQITPNVYQAMYNYKVSNKD